MDGLTDGQICYISIARQYADSRYKAAFFSEGGKPI